MPSAFIKLLVQKPEDTGTSNGKMKWLRVDIMASLIIETERAAPPETVFALFPAYTFGFIHSSLELDTTF